MNAKAKDRPKGQRRYRYWVEIRDLSEGSVRTLPLRVMKLVYLGGRRNDPPRPDEQRLQLRDDSAVIEAKDIDELAAQLREKYPDETHERRLHWERDLEAEQRYADALSSLIELLAKAVADDLLREQAGKADKP